ncbi:MAG: ribosome-associated translation inhibitor RaiA [Tissierellia bacterium]|nr:ribosome-associated translation inhibitor RaiA [Tissierellia bacterium]
MRLSYVGTNLQVSDEMKAYSEKKMGKLDKFFRDDLEGKIVFSHLRNLQTVEATINLPGTVLRAEETSTDMFTSIDKVVDVLERQIRKHKTKLQKKFRNNDTIRFDNFPMTDDQQDEGQGRIVRRKTFSLKPMSPEEAILQMELVGHNFFVYLDDEAQKVSVAYKRNDGNYGIIEAQN